MSFSSAISGLTVSKEGLLSGQCLKSDGKKVHATFNLDDHVGFVNGALVWGGKGFSKATDCHFSISNTGILTAKFKINGKQAEDHLDLHKYISNSDGAFTLISAQAARYVSFDDWGNLPFMLMPTFIVALKRTYIPLPLRFLASKHHYLKVTAFYRRVQSPLQLAKVRLFSLRLPPRPHSPRPLLCRALNQLPSPRKKHSDQCILGGKKY